MDRVLCRIDDEDYAAAGPAPGEAILVSAGPLPLRTHSAARGVHHRPEFPGTAVVIGGTCYEVMEEGLDASGRTSYTLRPWPETQLVRDRVRYDRDFVAAVRSERAAVARHAWGRRYLGPLYPVLGFLPEPLQISIGDRWGLDPVRATWLSGLSEAALLFAAWRRFDGITALLLAPLGAGYMLSCLLRALGALTVGEVAGSPLAAP